MKTKKPFVSSAVWLFAIGCLIFLQNFSIASAQTPIMNGQTVDNFFQAIAQNDTNTAFQMLEGNTNLVFSRYNSSKLPLLEAAAAGNFSLVKWMIELGADINATGDTLGSFGVQMTALEEAVQNGHLDICELLLKKGANPNHRSASGNTALHFAFDDFRGSQTNHYALAGLLLDSGANPFLEAGYYKYTPVELDIMHSDGKLIARMLNPSRATIAAAEKWPKKKNSPDLKEQASEFLVAHGVAMLQAAAQRGELEAVQALLKAGVSAKTNAPEDLSVLQAFALSALETTKDRQSAVGQLQQTRNRLEQLGTNADAGFLASFQSQEAEQAARVEASAPERWQQIKGLLIKNGADYDVFAATALNDTNQLRQLLAADKNVVQSRDRDGQTPLHWAVQTDQLLLTSFWIQSGVPLSATNSAGQTAMHLAAAKGLTEHLKLLLAAQAPTDVHDTNGWTPLDAAIHAQQTETIRLLLADKTVTPRPERSIATTLHEAAAAGNIAAFAALVETATNLEARNELGLTPLQVAVRHGHLAAAALLVDKGADVNVRDPDGNTLLQQILLQDRLTIYDRPPTNWLARMGVDPRKEIYVKYLVVGQYEQGPNPVLQAASFLLACGVDAKATNHAGQTAIQLVMEGKIPRSIFFFNDDQAMLLKLLGAGGGNIDERDADGNTALHRAADETIHGVDANELDRLTEIIASGADVNATNSEGKTPLHIMVQKMSWVNPLQILMNAKPNVNIQDKDGLTPLHVLAMADTSERPEATQMLLDASANPNLRDKHGRTPAHLFLSGAWPWNDAGGCVDMLVKAGADLSAKDDQGKTPLHYLAALGDQQPMFFIRGIGDTFIAAKVDFRARDNDGNTPLHIAAKTGTHDVFDWLVKQGADMDETNNAGETPRLLSAHNSNDFNPFGQPNPETDIFVAASDGKIEPLAALVKADPTLANKTNQYGLTPLRVAVLYHRTNAVEFLEQHGARWDIVSAVIFRQTQAAREILARQPVDIAVKNHGSPLLHLAAANGDVDTTKILLDAGGDLQAQDNRGLSPLGVAKLENQTAVAVILRQHGATENIFDVAYAGRLANTELLIMRDKSLALATNLSGVSVVEIAAGTGQADVLKFLLDNGASAEFISARDGRTPLHYAAIYNQTNTAKLLIRSGAKVDAYDKLGFTPLHLASICGSTEVAAQLIKNNADLKKLTTEPATNSMQRMPMMGELLLGDSALHLAAALGQTNITQLLLESGVSVNAVDDMGRTALDLATQSGFPPTSFSIQHDLRVTNPLGIATPPFIPRQLIQERLKMNVSLLEKAGGKRMNVIHRFGSRGFPQ